MLLKILLSLKFKNQRSLKKTLEFEVELPQELIFLVDVPSYRPFMTKNEKGSKRNRCITDMNAMKKLNYHYPNIDCNDKTDYVN